MAATDAISKYAEILKTVSGNNVYTNTERDKALTLTTAQAMFDCAYQISLLVEQQAKIETVLTTLADELKPAETTTTTA